MSAESNRRLAYFLMKAWSMDRNGDIEPYMSLFSDDAIFETMVADPDLIPELKGPWPKQVWREYLLAELKLFPIRYHITGVTADENRIAIETTCDVDINGHRYKNHYHLLAEVRDGKISRLRFYMDTLYAKQGLAWIRDAAQSKGGAVN
jgi:ketosteroid isomerase-like protein